MGYQGEKCDMNEIINPLFMGKWWNSNGYDWENHGISY